MPAASGVAKVAASLAREGLDRESRPPVAAASHPAWKRLREAGTRLWLDTGDLDEAARLWVAEFEALTTNNTLLNAEVQKGIYDGLVRGAAAAIRKADPAIDERALVLEIAFVLNARHGLRLVRAFDARVSVELHTDLAHDVERSVAYGRRFHAIRPDRFIVKVPLTAAGLLAARRLARAGIPVNFTLGFSARQNVAAARIADPAFVNVFMGRLNAFVADNKLGDGRNAGEKATLATQRALRDLRRSGRSGSLLIGASMREGSQVPALAGVDVYTMPPKVAAQYLQHPPERVVPHVEDDPPVSTAPGVRLEDFNAATLWDVPEAFVRATEDAAAGDVDALTPETLQDHYHRAGLGGFLPRWSAEDVAVATKEGKIPAWTTWRSRLASGEIGLDALLNLAALRAFTKDQQALDDRIRGLL